MTTARKATDNPIDLSHKSNREMAERKGLRTITPNIIPSICSLEDQQSYSPSWFPKNLLTLITQMAVTEIAEAYGTAIEHFFERQESELLTLHIGIGRELRALNVDHVFAQTKEMTISYEIVELLAKHTPLLGACPQTSRSVLGWTARRGLEELGRVSWV